MNAKTKKLLSIIALLMMGVAFIFVGSKDLVHSRQLAAQGKVTTAKVLDGEDNVSGRFHTHTCYLQLQFQPESGSAVSPRIEVGKDVYQSVQIGSIVKVHYLPEDPTICQAGETVETRFGKLLWGIGFLLGAGYLILFFQQPTGQKEAVESLGESVKTLSLTQFEYVSVDARNFKHLDLAFYNNGQRRLEAAGYRFLDDQENVTLRRRSGIRTFIRILLSGDRTTMADFYHFIPKFMLRILGAKPAKVLDLETWFSDGCFVCTSNAEMAGKLESPPTIDAQRLPAETTWDMLLETHQRRLGKYLMCHPGVSAVKLTGLADVRRAQDEQQRIKAEFRQRIGLSRTELQRFAGAPSRELDRLHNALTEHRERGNMKNLT
ncbi:MAG TPA: DUF3592 domain-containing protein [Verrucomicrobiae bacterium]|nr:DUF3592 domain-containing protein [Verrucomicrobiae bacterium]